MKNLLDFVCLVERMLELREIVYNPCRDTKPGQAAEKAVDEVRDAIREIREGTG